MLVSTPRLSTTTSSSLLLERFSRWLAIMAMSLFFRKTLGKDSERVRNPLSVFFLTMGF